MDHPKSHTEGNPAFFREIYENSGLWSCTGYDGLSIAFGLPIEDIRSLSEDRKRALMCLLGRLAKMNDESLLDRIQALEGLTVSERLAGLMHLSAQV